MKMVHPEYKHLEKVMRPMIGNILSVGKLFSFSMKYVDGKLNERFRILVAFF